MINQRLNQLSITQRELLAQKISNRHSRLNDRLEVSAKKQLVAWYTTDGKSSVSERDIRNHIESKVANQVIPRHFLKLDSLPRTSNGKVDRKKLLNSVVKTKAKVPSQVSPESEMEKNLASIWQQALESDEFTIDDNFFEIGGDSLSVIKAIALCSESGLHLTPGLFYANPSIRKLAQVLTTNDSKPETENHFAPPTISTDSKTEQPVVKTNSKSSNGVKPVLLSQKEVGSPIFLIPPKGFALGELRHLVEAIEKHTCYGPYTPERDAPDIRTVRELAKDFIEQMQEIQPTGPYLVAGTCEGAYIAWDIAILLSRMGESVGFVGIIDTPNPTSMTQRPLMDRLRLRLRSLQPGSLIKMSFEVSRRIVKKVQRQFKSVVVKEKHITNAGSRMGWLFTPEKFEGSATLFRAIHKFENTDFETDNMHGWSNLPNEGLDVRPIPCTRLEMLEPPNASIVAEKMERAIADSLANLRTKTNLPTKTKPLRILTIANVQFDPNSGAAGTDIAINDIFEKAGHQVDAVWESDLGKKWITHGNLSYAFEAPRLIRKIVLDRIRQNEYDVVLMDQPIAYLAAQKLREQGFSGIIVNRSHGFEPAYKNAMEKWSKELETKKTGYPKSILSRWLHKKLENQWSEIVEHCDGVALSTTLDHEFYSKYFPKNSCKAEVIQQGVPESFFENFEERKILSDGSKSRLLYVGQYAEFKAPSILIKIVNRVLSENSELTMTWITSEKHHEIIRQQLNPKIRAQVELMNWMPQSELIPLYKQHDIFLFPSVYEGFGKAMLEAMSSGMCVVASNVGAMHDLIEHEQSGLLCNPCDVDGFCQAIDSLIKHPEKQIELGQSAKAATSELTWKRCGDQYLEFFHQLLEEKRK